MKKFPFAISVILSVLFLCSVSPAHPASAQESGLLRVYIGGEESTVYPALNWAGWMVFVLVDAPDDADVLLLNGTIPDADTVHGRLEEGAGMVLILGPDITSEQFTQATGIPVTLEPADDPVHPREPLVFGEPVLKQIPWSRAPMLRERSRVMTPVSSVTPMISGTEDGDWLIWSLPGGTVFIVDFHLGKADNSDFREWEYYNYLIYQLVVRAGGREPLDYAEYPGAILPAASGNGPLLFTLALLVAVGLLVFFVIRRLSTTPPEETSESLRSQKKWAGYGKN
jgi:hypothetical protein